MKPFLFFLLVPFFALAQTAAEREKIVDTYDKEASRKVQADAAEAYKFQQSLIENYKKVNAFTDSELKTLHRIENGLPIFYRIYNQGSSNTIGTSKMYPGGSMGLNVTGLGMTAGVWDGGKVRDTHQEFSGGKVILGDAAATLNVHSTHVTGTVIATGVSPARKGIAYQAQAKTYDWDADYSEMLVFGAAGFLVSNHSYGYVAADLPVYKFGSYDSSSIEDDTAANTYPFYQIVKAAGNDRADFSLTQVGNKGGYDLLTGSSCAKNSIVVAAVEEVASYIDPSSVVMSSFSNFGPTDDGRIKPDVSAKGVDVSSTSSLSNAAYSSLQGTSMAAPAITGMVVLLQKHYNNLNTGSYMKAATVRGLICHSAKEAGMNPGPDYEFGWGLADAEAAANIITNRNVSTVLDENNLANGATFTKLVQITSAQNLSATICWTDPAGTSNGTAEDNRTPRLRNNLDLKILKDGNIFYPWRLEVEDPVGAATNTADNDVDNVEKVEILNAEPGIYTIQVTHKGSLIGGSQNFALIANATNGLTLNNDDYVFDNSVFVYPNPATNVLNFEIKNGVELSSVNIHDISGKIVFNNSNIGTSSAIDISNLSSGVYFVTFQSDSNSVTKKFIKE